MPRKPCDFQVSLYLLCIKSAESVPIILSFLVENAVKAVRNSGDINVSADKILLNLHRFLDRRRLVNRKQLAGEPMDQFHFSLLDLAAKACPSQSQGDRDAVVC